MGDVAVDLILVSQILKPLALSFICTCVQLPMSDNLMWSIFSILELRVLFLAAIVDARFF